MCNVFSVAYTHVSKIEFIMTSNSHYNNFVQLYYEKIKYTFILPNFTVYLYPQC